MLVVGGLLLGQIFAHWWQQKKIPSEPTKGFWTIRSFQIFFELTIWMVDKSHPYNGRLPIDTPWAISRHHSMSYALSNCCHPHCLHLITTCCHHLQCCKFYIRDHDQYACKILCNSRLIRWNLLPIKGPLPPYPHITWHIWALTFLTH